MITLDKIYHAKYVLSDVIRETDVIHAPHINESSKIYLKTENLQITRYISARCTAFSRKLATFASEFTESTTLNKLS